MLKTSENQSFTQLHKKVIQEHQLNLVLSGSISRHREDIDELTRKYILNIRTFCMLDTWYSRLSLTGIAPFLQSPIYRRQKDPLVYESPIALPLNLDVTMGINSLLKFIYATPPTFTNPSQNSYWLSNYTSFMTVFLHCIVKYFSVRNRNILNNRLEYNPCDSQISFFNSSTFPAIFGYGWCAEQGVAYVHALVEILKLQIVRICKSNPNSTTQSEKLQNKNEDDNIIYSEYDLLSEKDKAESIGSSDFFYSFINKLITQFLHMAGIQNYLRAALSTDFWTLINDEDIISHEKENNLTSRMTSTSLTSSAINVHSIPLVSTKEQSKKKHLKSKKQIPKIIPNQIIREIQVNKSDEVQQNEDKQLSKKQFLTRLLKYAKQFTESLLQNISHIPTIIRYFFQKVSEIDKSGLLVEVIFIDYLLKPALLKPKFFALIPETAVFSSTTQLTILTKLFKASIHEHLIPEEYRDILTGKDQNQDDNDESPMELFKEMNVKRIIERLSSDDCFDGNLDGLNALNIQSVTSIHYNLLLISVNDMKFITKIINDTIDEIDCFDETENPNVPPKFLGHVHISEKKKIKSLCAFGEKTELKNNELIEFWYQSFRLPNISTKKHSKKDKKKRKNKDKKSKREKKKDTNEKDKPSELNVPNETKEAIDNGNDNNNEQNPPSPDVQFKSSNSNGIRRIIPPWKKQIVLKNPIPTSQPVENNKKNIELHDEKEDFDISSYFKKTIPPLLLPIIIVPEVQPFDPKDPYIKTIHHLASYLQEIPPYSSSNDDIKLMDFLDIQLKHAIQIKSIEWVTRTQAISNKLKNFHMDESEILSTLSNIVNTGLKNSSDLLASSFKHEEICDSINNRLAATNSLRAQLDPISSQALLRKFLSTKQTIKEEIVSRLNTFTQINEWVNFFKNECVTQIDEFVDTFLASATNPPAPKEPEKDSQTSSKSKSKSKAKRTTSLNNETDEYKNQTNNLNTSFNDNELKTIKLNLTRQFHSELCSKFLSFSDFKQLTNHVYSRQDKLLQENYDKILDNYLNPDNPQESFSKVLLRLFSAPSTFESAINTLQKGISAGAPLERLEQIDETLTITQEIYKFEAGESAAADDLIPLFINVLIRAKIPELASVTNYIDHFLSSLTQSVKIVDHKEEYVLTTFLTASNFVIGEAEKMQQ